jgi:SAM-dependent methyltransferase
MNEQKCRFCSTPGLKSVVNLGMSPLSNSFLRPGQLANMEPFFPLNLLVCEKCYLVQLEACEDPVSIFDSDYAYFSSFSEMWLRHAKLYVDKMMKNHGFGKESLVVEIASNDGYLLQYFAKEGVPVLGIEPAGNVAAAAIKKGIPTEIAFFGAERGRLLASQNRQADLIIGNNVLAHVPDINDFVAGIKLALKHDGIVTIEFPHLLRLIEDNLFDTIYHEHYSYFSFLAAEKIFSAHGLRLFDVEQLDTHGGSLRIFGCHAEHSRPDVTANLDRLRREETEFGLFSIEKLGAYGRQVEANKRETLSFLIRARSSGKRVAGYGAPAKATTFMNFCGIRTDLVEYTVDISPHKQGRYIPGVHVPILSPDTVRETKPDYVVIFPWNIASEIMEQMSYIRDWGARFVTFIPYLKVLE